MLHGIVRQEWWNLGDSLTGQRDRQQVRVVVCDGLVHWRGVCLEDVRWLYQLVLQRI